MHEVIEPIPNLTVLLPERFRRRLREVLRFKEAARNLLDNFQGE